jgi:hypothetical protein
VEYETVRTERAGHAHKLIQTVDPRQYSGVVTVSGDGLVHEVTFFDNLFKILLKSINHFSVYMYNPPIIFLFTIHQSSSCLQSINHLSVHNSSIPFLFHVSETHVCYVQVINGMSKRTDSEEFMRDFPIGIVPGSNGT